ELLGSNGVVAALHCAEETQTLAARPGPAPPPNVMNDRELDNLLRSQPAPARGDSYWQEFPGRVTEQLPPRRGARVAKDWVCHPAGPAWRLGMAGACAVFVVVLLLKLSGNRQPQADLQVARQCYREAAGLFPGQLQAVIMESGNVRLQLADRP